jgi:ABC-2 type transport system ATP-binding protein
MTSSYAIECEGLRRVFRSRRLTGQVEEVVALDSLGLQVRPGEVYGVLGPNGAGKTTAIRIFSTLLIPTAGTARVMGHDVVKAAGEVRRRIGLILGGERGLYERLTGRQNLEYFASLYLMSPRRGAKRAATALEEVGLAHAGDRRVEQYSRGMRQRLHVARGLLPDPDVIFMDEPTIGLDPEAARDFRRLVPELRDRGKTVLLTTHYMLEADVLCERIAVIDHGKLVALDTPEGLKRRFGQEQVTEATLRIPAPDLAERLRAMRGVTAVESDMEGAAQRIRVYSGAGRDVASALRSLAGADALQGVVTREPTLEEAYLSLIRESSEG